MFAPRNEGDLKSVRGTIGDDERASSAKKIVRKSKPPSELANTRGSVQPSLEDSRNPVTIPARPTVASSAPDQSICLTCESRLSGTCRTEIPTTITPSGTFSRNAQRQEAYWMSHPPSSGPKAVVIAVKPDHVPIALPR